MAERYKADLEDATAKLNSLMVHRETLEERIAKQKKIVAALRQLVEFDEEAPTSERLVHGITDACRTVLRATGRPLLPVEVRDEVEKLGVPPQANLLASVYTVLRRLQLANEIVQVEAHVNPGGSAVMGYLWARPTQTLGYTVVTGKGKK